MPCGFGELGHSLVSMLESPMLQTLERGAVPYVALNSSQLAAKLPEMLLLVCCVKMPPNA